MNVSIVYDSRKGTTGRAARAMAQRFTAAGHACVVSSVQTANPREVAEADLICVGSWTVGLVLFGQRPTEATLSFVDQLGNLSGKKAVAFCTYKIATGKLLPKLARALENRGAAVLGTFKYRGPTPSPDFARLVETLPKAAA